MEKDKGANIAGIIRVANALVAKYPQEPFPYDDLVMENRRRGPGDAEYKLLDTGVFDDHRYFDFFVEYAKAGAEDILIRTTAHNRGPEAASLDLLPTIWFRNTWSWGYDSGPMGDVPGRLVLKGIKGLQGEAVVHLSHLAAGKILETIRFLSLPS